MLIIFVEYWGDLLGMTQDGVGRPPWGDTWADGGGESKVVQYIAPFSCRGTPINSLLDLPVLFAFMPV